MKRRSATTRARVTHACLMHACVAAGVLLVLGGTPTAWGQTTGGGGGGFSGGGGTGGGTGGSSSGGVFSPSTGSSGSFSSGMSGQTTTNGQGGSTTGLQGVQSQAAVKIRTGFLNPLLQKDAGFLSPSNSTAATSRTGSARGTTGGLTTTSRFGAAGGLGGGGLTGRGGLTGFGSQFSATGLQTGTGATAPMRVPIAVADPRLNALAGASAVRVTRFNERLRRLPGVGPASSAQLVMQGQTAVLQGRVETPQQRELLARLALLEPGIAAVQNELVVTPLPGRSEDLPAAAPGGSP